MSNTQRDAHPSVTTASDSFTSVDCFTTADSTRPLGLFGRDAGTILAEDPLSIGLLQARPDGPFGPADDLLCMIQRMWLVRLLPFHSHLDEPLL